MFSTRDEDLISGVAKMLRKMEPMEWEPIIAQAKKRVREEDGLPREAVKPQPVAASPRPFPGAAPALALFNVQRGSGTGVMGVPPGNTP